MVMGTKPSIPYVIYQMSSKKRNYSVGSTVPYGMMNYRWYQLGQYMAILAGTWCYRVSINWYCLVLGVTGYLRAFMPVYIEQSGDLVRYYRCLTHRQQNIELLRLSKVQSLSWVTHCAYELSVWSIFPCALWITRLRIVNIFYTICDSSYTHSATREGFTQKLDPSLSMKTCKILMRAWQVYYSVYTLRIWKLVWLCIFFTNTLPINLSI